MDGDLTLTFPGHEPIRFVPAGQHRSLAPGRSATLTFEVQGDRVQAVQLDGHQEVTLLPGPPWQATLMKLGRRVGLAGTTAPQLTE